MPGSVLKLENLCFSYGQSPILAGLNLELGPGESIALTGANGSGKTTLFRCITGLEQIASGGIYLEGDSVASAADFQKLRRRVGYSVQNAEDQLIFPTVLEDVTFGPLNLGLTETEASRKASEMLDRLGLKGREDCLTHQLSGGQQKLAAIAAVLVMGPDVLLLDEPFNALDSAACARLRAILAELASAKIIVAHDQSLLSGLCERTVRLVNGLIEPVS